MQVNKVITISGIEVSVTKNKGQKNLYVKVCPPDGQVKVSSPFYVSDKQIKEFVQSKLPTIKRHQERLISQVRQDKREYVSGEAFYFWGKPLMLQVVPSANSRCKIKRVPNRLILEAPKGCSVALREKKINEWYRVELKRAIENIAPTLEKRVGVKASEFRIKNMKTRWGTCNVFAKRIWINLQLAKKPPECLEYILVHELCHLLERKHTKLFWAYVEQFCPNWKSAKNTLDAMPLDYLEQKG